MLGPHTSDPLLGESVLGSWTALRSNKHVYTQQHGLILNMECGVTRSEIMAHSYLGKLDTPTQ